MSEEKNERNELSDSNGSESEEPKAWQGFARQFVNLEGFEPNPRDKHHRNLYAYYCAGMWDQHIKISSQNIEMTRK